MDTEIVCRRINKLLDDSGYALHFISIDDIEGFLSEGANFDHDAYEVIEQLYTQLMDDVDLLE